MKHLLSLATLLLMAMTCFTSCEEEETIKDAQYAYVAVLNDISQDLIDLYDVRVDVTAPGVTPKREHLTSTADWQWAETSALAGTVTLKVTFTPHDIHAIDADATYDLCIAGGVGGGKVTAQRPDMKVEYLANYRGIKGEFLKSKGTFSSEISLQVK